MAREGTSVEKAQTAPHEDDSRKPDPGGPDRPSGVHRHKALTEFGRDQCTDLAAALTYYAVGDLPGDAGAGVAARRLRRGQSTTDALLDIVRQLGQGSAADALQGPIEQVADPGGGPRLHRRNPRRHLVRVGLRGGLRPGHEPDLPDRRGAPRVEARPLQLC